jgi:hypothetical protein
MPHHDCISWSDPFWTKGDDQPLGAAFVDDESTLQGYASRSPFSYPFKKLAWLNKTDDSTMFLYRQLDGLTIAEDAYSPGGNWTTINITVDLYP